MITIGAVLLYAVIALFVVAIIAAAVISFTTGWNKTGRLTGGLYCLRGPPSCGKSFVAAALAVQFMRKGRRVFTNTPVIYRNGVEELISRRVEKEDLLDKNLNGSVIIGDEIYRWFWSRDFKKFTEEYALYFATLAQHGISFYYILQHEDRVDTILNDCANLFGEISKVEIPLIEMPFYFEICWYESEIEMQMSRTNPSIQPYHVEKIFFDKDIAAAYDTCWFGKDPREEYEGVDWVTWLKSQGLYEEKHFDHSIMNKIRFVLHRFKIRILVYYVRYFMPTVETIKVKIPIIKAKFKILSVSIREYMKKGKEYLMNEIASRFDRDKEREDTEQNYIDESLLEDDKK